MQLIVHSPCYGCAPEIDGQGESGSGSECYFWRLKGYNFRRPSCTGSALTRNDKFPQREQSRHRAPTFCRQIWFFWEEKIFLQIDGCLSDSSVAEGTCSPLGNLLYSPIWIEFEVLIENFRSSGQLASFHFVICHYKTRILKSIASIRGLQSACGWHVCFRAMCITRLTMGAFDSVNQQLLC